MSSRRSGYEVAIVGGAGHVGAPLAILLAARNIPTLIHDINREAMASLAAGTLPFIEVRGPEMLSEALERGTLGFADSIAEVSGVPFVIVTIGTPIDEFQNPSLGVITRCIDELAPHLDDGQTIILRSTVFPGATEYVDRYLRAKGKNVLVAFCPERAVEGRAIMEMQALPQIVSGTSPAAKAAAAELFSRIAPSVVPMIPKEAEYAKLFCNAYRYIQFAAANQFFMMVEEAGLDYARLLAAIKKDYPRMRDLPGPGFAAGPCLYKDTLQLAASSNNQFGLGYSAIQVNEGLPNFLVERMRSRFDLATSTVGLLGMAFKADSDDVRASLSYKLKKLLTLHAKEVLTTDPLVRDPELSPLDEVVARSDIIVICVPHSAYVGMDLGSAVVLDLWNVHTQGTPWREIADPVALA